MTGHDDFAFEPIPGLPTEPPKGELILWQGRPDTMSLALQAYGLAWVAAYFVGLIVWRGSVGFNLAGMQGAIAFALPYAAIGLVGCGLIYLMAWIQARATVYTITSARVAMRIGAALTVTLNLPFTQIGDATLAKGRRGTGNIALRLLGDTRLSYLVVWPHVRPWFIARTQPTLRCIPEAAKVAQLLADAAHTRIAQPVVTRPAPSVGALMAAE